MMEKSLRYEIKLRVTEARLSHIKIWMALHPRGFKKSYPDRVVNNLYFDTDDFKAYQDNVNGVSRRRKLRLRWYNRTASPEKAVLEVKNKAGRLGWKDGVAVDLRDCDIVQMDPIRFERLLLDKLPLRFSALLESRSSVLYNRYERQYFEDAAGEVRITIDGKLGFGWPGPGRPIMARQRSASSDEVIMEVKFSKAAMAAGSDVIGSLPLRSTRFSKYVEGLRTLWSF